MNRFAEPIYLSLIPLIALLALWYRRRLRKPTSFGFSSLSIFGQYKAPSWQIWVLPGLRLGALCLLAFALARPVAEMTEHKRKTEGLDIMLAIDTSGSMRALDFELNGERESRIDVVKAVIAEFIKSRSDDRVGMVVFGAEAFMQAPLTLDHDVLVKFLDQVKVGVAGDSTAIGDAIAVSVKRIKDIPAKSKVVILLTDGKNNAGKIEPLTAANAAKTMDVKVYTIGVGTNGKVPYPVDTAWGPRLIYQVFETDEPLLQKIAEMTGAKYFHASDASKLAEVYKTIDELEKTAVEQNVFVQKEEKYSVFLLPALLLLALEVIGQLTPLRRLP